MSAIDCWYSEMKSPSPKDREKDFYHLWLVLLFILCCFQFIYLSIGVYSRELFLVMQDQQLLRELPFSTKLVISPLFPWGTSILGLVLLFLSMRRWRKSVPVAKSCALMFVLCCLILIGLRAPIGEITVPAEVSSEELLLAPRFDGSELVGFRVMRVLPLSRLEASNLRPGDTLLTIDGARPENVFSANRMFAKGNELRLEIERNSTKLKLNIPERQG